MKYKIGDIVKIVSCNSTHKFRLGELVEIITIKEDTEYQPYECKSLEYDEVWWVYENEIVFADYTWEKFLEAPMGTKIILDDGVVFLHIGDNMCCSFRLSGNIACKVDLNDCDGLKSLYNCNNFKSFEDYVHRKIIKIEEPTYTTVYEPKEEIKEMTIEEIEEKLGYKIKIKGSD